MTQPAASPTLDTLFKRSLARQPDATALVDPPNKLRVTGQTPKRLTYAQADRAISSLAAHFIESGLPANSVIAVQLPNTIEFALTILAAYRAGLVVAVLPLLWRQAELTMALNRTAARAIVTTSKVDGIVYSDLAMNAAAEAFSIRHVCGFGTDLPEGMASLDNAILRESTTARAVIQDGRKAALISFDLTSDGFRPVPRAHLGLIAGGLSVSLESDVPQGATILSAFSPMSFAGLASSLAVWLLSGGTLVLHHPFDEEVLEQQVNEHACDTLIAPAQLALRLDELDLAGQPALPAQRHRLVARAGTGDVERVLVGPAGNADRRLSVRRSRFVRRAPDRGRWFAGPDQARTARRAARTAGLLDRGRNPADAAGHARTARTDDPGRSLCAAAAAQRLADRSPAARLRRHGLFRAARPLDRRHQHHRAARPASWRSAATASWRRTCRNGRGGSDKARCSRHCRIASAAIGLPAAPRTTPAPATR